VSFGEAGLALTLKKTYNPHNHLYEFKRVHASRVVPFAGEYLLSKNVGIYLS
jgi:hypothetical protein